MLFSIYFRTQGEGLTYSVAVLLAVAAAAKYTSAKCVVFCSGNDAHMNAFLFYFMIEIVVDFLVILLRPKIIYLSRSLEAQII